MSLVVIKRWNSNRVNLQISSVLARYLLNKKGAA